MTITRDDILEWIKASADVIAENRAYLIKLDSPIGDADHGANMDRGFKAILGKLPEVEDKDIGTILKTSGMTLVSKVGGAGGPLYGTFFMQMGMKVAGKEELTLEEWAEALQAGVEGVKKRGRAELEDKTMVDALVPAANALSEAVKNGKSRTEALEACAAAAEEGMKATIPLVARKGRASYVGERSKGHQDPGATSSYLLLKMAKDTWG